MRDRAEYRETYLLRRGQYDLPDTSEALWPAMPAVLPPLPSDAPANRLGLALWMTDPKNPLVSRVAVNRVWFQFFGRGIVDSVDNFGVQGTPPTHPQLLDWLAQDFQKSGWDVKRLIKQMVMSATYRHSSEASTTHLAADPGNHFYTRGTRQRLTGEMLRDNALFVSGLLVEKLGGPSVAPYQPEGLWEELAGGASNGPYVMSQGDDLFRRSLYTYRKRTVSHPTVATFDAPSWEICQIKRATTNTPLQALALLNDVTYVEAARHLARQMLSEPSEVPEQVIAAGFRTAILREPTERELSVLVQGWNNYWEFYRDHPEAAQELLSIGATAEAALPDSAVDAARLAAYATTASVILNLDEFIVKE
jgi:hypothetical protein